MNPTNLDEMMALVVIGLLILFTYFVGEAILRRRKRKVADPTPVTEEGLTQYDDLPPGIAVVMAWSEAGANPHWHEMRQDDVRAEMPLLGRALDRLAEIDS